MCNYHFPRVTFLSIIGASPNGRNLYKFKKLLCKIIILKEKKLYPSDGHTVDLIFAISGVIGVFEEWLFDGIKLSQKKIADSLYKILQNFECKMIQCLVLLIISLTQLTNGKIYSLDDMS